MTRKRVLLVDDDEIFRDAVTAVLETRYQVSTAGSGGEALAAVQAELPDLVILDVMMDHLSEGFDVARVLRTGQTTSSIPIVMLTGVDQVYNMRLEIEDTWAPYDRYLEKPVAPEALLATVRELLGEP